jgi:hypothetical protein
MNTSSCGPSEIAVTGDTEGRDGRHTQGVLKETVRRVLTLDSAPAK